MQHTLQLEVLPSLSEDGFSLDELVLQTRKLFEIQGMAGLIGLILRLVDELICRRRDAFVASAAMSFLRQVPDFLTDVSGSGDSGRRPRTGHDDGPPGYGSIRVRGPEAPGEVERPGHAGSGPWTQTKGAETVSPAFCGAYEWAIQGANL